MFTIIQLTFIFSLRDGIIIKVREEREIQKERERESERERERDREREGERGSLQIEPGSHLSRATA